MGIGQLSVALGSSWFFFNSDTIYYLARRIRSLADVWGILMQYDDRGNFRPFNFYLSSGLLVPLGGIQPWVYHAVAAGMHALNTWLVFLLIRRLIADRLIAAMAAFFFGLHWVQFNITYGLVCLPDLTYVAFILLALLAFARSLEEPHWRWKTAGLAAAAGAFLCKEMAVILPALFAVLSWIRSGKVDAERPIGHRVADALRRSGPAWILAILYLCHFAILGGGSILPTNPAHPYAVEFSWARLAEKAPYLGWTANFPNFYDLSGGASEVMRVIAEHISPAGSEKILGRLFLAEHLLRWAATALWLPVVVWGLAQTIQCALVRRYLPFCLALVASLLPTLFLARKIMPHNVYLASAGFGIWMALCLGSLRPGLPWYRLQWTSLRSWAFFSFLTASLAGIYGEASHSWLTHGSLMAREAVEDVRHTLPALASNSSLYFLKSGDGGLPWYYDGGNLFRLVLQKPRLWVRFQDRGDTLPTWIARKSGSHVLRVEGRHMYEVTEDYLLPTDRVEQDLLASFDMSTLRFERTESAQQGDKLVFPALIHRFHIGRRALILPAGASISARFTAKSVPAELIIRACLVQDSGDGMLGRVTLSSPGRQQVVLEHEFLPQRRQGEGAWLERRVELNSFAGQPLEVRLECFSPGGREATANQTAWSIRITLPDE